jgi:DNA-directed RNA polymerase subunit omega
MRLEKIIATALKNANDDHYILSLMVSKRANDLAEGAEPFYKVDKNKVKLTDIALIEIANDYVMLDKIVEK